MRRSIPVSLSIVLGILVAGVVVLGIVISHELRSESHAIPRPQVRAARISDDPSATPVHDFNAYGYTLEVVRKLAVTYRVVIGAYGSMPMGKDKIISVSKKTGTIRDVLDMVTKTDPRFEWHSSGRAIHLVAIYAPFTLMDVRVPSFDLATNKSGDALGQLRSVPAVQRWHREHKCPTDYAILHTWGDVVSTAYFSVHAQDVPVLAVLDEIAANSQTYYWSYFQDSTRPCSITTFWSASEADIAQSQRGMVKNLPTPNY